MPLIARVTLRDVRSYPALDLEVGARMVALVGDNGAGKTNLLEALSLLSPGGACAGPSSPRSRARRARAASRSA